MYYISIVKYLKYKFNRSHTIGFNVQDEDCKNAKIDK